MDCPLALTSASTLCFYCTVLRGHLQSEQEEYFKWTMEINILKTPLKLWQLQKLLGDPKLNWVWKQAGQIHGKYIHLGLLDVMLQRHWEVWKWLWGCGTLWRWGTLISYLLSSYPALSVVKIYNIHFSAGHIKECYLSPHCCRDPWRLLSAPRFYHSGLHPKYAGGEMMPWHRNSSLAIIDSLNVVSLI